MPISHLLSQSFYNQSSQAENSKIGNGNTSTVLQNGLLIRHSHEETRQNETKFVLIDTDGGTDDAWALYMSLAAHKDLDTFGFQIVGITTVSGNCTGAVTNNVNHILNSAQEKMIPLFKGMNSSMIGKLLTPKKDDDINNNVKDGNLDSVLTSNRVQSEHSVNAIVRLAEAYKGQLTIMCLGPLTNLAMALKLKPEIKNYIKEVFIDGGNIEGVGNATPSSEFNFFLDPEAVRVVFDNMSPCPITILPLETCMKFATSRHEWRTNVLGEMKSNEIKLLNKIEYQALKSNRVSWTVCAAALAACVINSEVIKEKRDYYCNVELQGSLTRGMMVVDKHFMYQKPSNASVILELDQSLYESMLIWAAGGPEYKSLNSFEMHYW